MSKDTERSALADRLFVGVMPAGISYADKTIDEDGDYARVASLSYSTLVLVIYHPRSPLLPLIREDAERMQARRGQMFQVSTAGQTVLLGRE